MKEFLLITFGSSGDVNPFVGLGAALLRRGHRVTLATNPYFQDLIRQAGLAFVPIGTAQEFRDTLDHPDLWHPQRGLRFVVQHGMLPLLRPSYDLVKSFSESKKVTVVASLLALGARIAQEKLGVPLVTVHLQPTAFASLYETPIYPQANVSRWPRWMKKLAYRWGGSMIDRYLAPDFNRFRWELGLSPLHNIFGGWVHSPALALGLWPEWFAAPQPDWPPQARLTGFPLYDAGTLEKIPAELDTFLSAGPPPVVFTPGSAMRQGRRFFEESAKACQAIGCRAVFLTKFPEQVPAGLPFTIRTFGYVPFSHILPRAAVFVHHGGIGTMSQALAGGTPQLVMPLSHDQPDNAARAKRLGVSLTLNAERYQSKRLIPLLQELLNNVAYKQNAMAIQKRFTGENPMDETCRLIESIS